MPIEKHSEDLEKLVSIARSQEDKLNISFVLITIKADTEEIQEVFNYLQDNGIELVNSDVEVEVDNEEVSINENIKPFDPSKIDIKMDKMTIDSLIKRIRYGELKFDSDFQRQAGLWKLTQKSQLIESILLKIPLPAFYFDAAIDDKWLIIDGLQRLSTLKEYAVDKSFRLYGMEFLIELNGLSFDELPRSLQRRIEETNVNSYLVSPATPHNVKFNIFKRINTGGLVLEPQEIRNALYQGTGSKFLKELSTELSFKEATGNSIKSDRMLDREFCLRYIAFTEITPNEYNGTIEDLLNYSMEFLNTCQVDKYEVMRINFVRSMKSCSRIFGYYAFRKMASDGRRRPINKAIFAIWSHITFRATDNQIKQMIDNKYLIQKEFITLCEDYLFQNYLKASDKKSIYAGIKLIEEKILIKIGVRFND